MLLRRHCTLISGLLLLAACGVQGCLALVWLGAVGIDATRTSDVEFHSFENASVAAQQEQTLASVESIAVMPFLDDPVMAERWTAVLQQITDLRVVSPSSGMWPGGDGDERIAALAQRVSVDLQVDCVLFGSVVGQESRNSFAGVKERFSRRLYLHLMSASGSLMWKAELPFTMVKGGKDLDEGWVTQALLTHVLAHADEVGLAELGAKYRRAAASFYYARGVRPSTGAAITDGRTSSWYGGTQ